MNKLILILILVIVQGAAMAQGQNTFNPVAPTGIPYSIIITGVSLNGSALSDTADLAVFDDTLCVGTIQYADNGNLQLVAWQGDPSQSLPGFTLGHPMSFKVRLKWGSDYYIEVANPSFANGNGNFGYGTFSVLSLQVTSTIVGIDPIINSDEISIFPNPFSEDVNFDLTGKDCQGIEFFDFSGRMIYQEALAPNSPEIRIPAGKILSAKSGNCLLIVKCRCDNELVIRKLYYQGQP